MAVRFNATGEALTISTGVLDYNSAYTWAAWAYITTTTQWEAIFCIGNNSPDVRPVDFIGHNDAGQWVVGANPDDAYQNIEGGTCTTGWHHMAFVRASTTSALLYVDGVLTVSNLNSVAGRSASTRIDIARSSSGNGDAFNGRISHIKIWTAALSVAEVQQEMYNARPVRYDSLWLWSPLLLHTDLNDYSGNGRNWTGAGTISTEDGPPATWGAAVLSMPTVSAGPAAQTINANAISSAAAVYAPAITPGAVTIALDAVSSGATVYAPTLTPGAVTVALNAIASATTIHEPAVTVGAATITPDAISSTAAVYEPAITPGPVTVALNAIDSTAQVYEPAISSGAITITPNVIESTAEVYAPAITPGAVTIQADSISSTAAVFEPAISTGALLIQPSRIESTAEVYQPAISGGAVVIAPDVIGSTAQVFEPAITPGAVTVAPDFVTSSAAVYAPGIGYVIRPDIIDSAAAVYAPAVTTGATTIAAAFIASTAQVYAPTITGGVPAVIGGILITLPADYTSISVPTDYTSITIPADSGRSS